MALKKPHHPPEPGHYERPWTDVPRYIFGNDDIAGWGDRWFYVAIVPRCVAVDMIKRNHYSGTVVNNSYLHLGIFMDSVLVGVMQWGYALNPASTGHIVLGSTSTDYLELNRMWLDDVAPRNSESRAISYAVRYIRKAMPHVKWLQSFADGRCGRLGVVYQAASWMYLGYHNAMFYELDGQTYHKIAMTAATRGGRRGAFLRANADRATSRQWRQYRYVKILYRPWQRRLLLTPLPYPKAG